MKKLIAFLLDKMIFDLKREITLETVRNFLREDDGREARQLLSKLIEDKSIEDMLAALADPLRQASRTGGVNEKLVLEQLSLYSES